MSPFLLTIQDGHHAALLCAHCLDDHNASDDLSHCKSLRVLFSATNSPKANTYAMSAAISTIDKFSSKQRVFQTRQ